MDIENGEHDWQKNPETGEMECQKCFKKQEKAEKPPEPECKPTYATPRDIEL